MQIAEYIIVGGGAVGAAMSAGLWRAGARLSIIGREASDPGARGQVRVCGWPGLPPVTLPQALWRKPKPAATDEDGCRVFVLATKSYHLPALRGFLRQSVGPNDLVVLTQNGLDVEACLAGAVPARQLLRMILDFGAVIEGGEARITYMAPCSHIGALEPNMEASVKRVAHELSLAGFVTEPSSNIAHHAWRKLVIGGMALVCVLFDLPIGQALERGDGAKLYRRLAAERIRVATALGHDFSSLSVERCVEINRKAHAHVPSMLIDHRLRRPLELSHDAMKVIAYARMHAIPAPANEEIMRRLGRKAAARSADSPSLEVTG